MIVHTCPGCSDNGVLTDDPSVLRCQSCGGVFTTERITEAQGFKFVSFNRPMLHDSNDMFYFDFVVDNGDTVDRMHGWADKATKRVVQWG